MLASSLEFDFADLPPDFLEDNFSSEVVSKSVDSISRDDPDVTYI